MSEQNSKPQQPLHPEERYSGLTDPDIQRWLDMQRAPAQQNRKREWDIIGATRRIYAVGNQTRISSHLGEVA
jgi:hypothetical protein